MRISSLWVRVEGVEPPADAFVVGSLNADPATLDQDIRDGQCYCRGPLALHPFHSASGWSDS